MGSAKILMDKKTWLPAVISVLLAAGMVAAAEITGEREIIFPEITAIAMGALAAPKQVWNTSKLRLFAAVALSAGTGAAIVRLLPLPFWVQAPLGIFCAAGYITLLADLCPQYPPAFCRYLCRWAGRRTSSPLWT